ncbi:hypothetical protein [Luteolibacter sp. Populi]|uniref:hypothetical protein n=1 Tax=Luteolibacter sp. Populi TaxID=3230487 RepID=UPI003465E1C8
MPLVENFRCGIDSSEVAAWKLPATGWNVFHRERARLEYRKPIGVCGHAAEDQRVSVLIETEIKPITR